jgi:hypothetical protein
VVVLRLPRQLTHPARLLPAAFVLAITVGTLVLMLPWARRGPGGTDPMTALFTATSAVCVTGLTVVDTGQYWTFAGQVVIMMLILVGGFGITALATLIVLSVAGRLGLQTRLAAQRETKTLALGDVTGVLVRVGLVMLTLQATVAAVLTARLLTGDFLFARASELVADLGPEAVRLQSRTFARLVRGQIRETVGPSPEEDPVEHYLAVLADKTGSLIATSARFGAWLWGAPAEQVETVTRFGEAIGVAFQLADDVIDVVSDGEESGKTPGTDLREGVPTLPSLYARRSVAPDDARLRGLLAGPVANDDMDEALALLRAHPALEESQREVRRWAEKARAELDSLPPGAARSALEEICASVVTRSG